MLLCPSNFAMHSLDGEYDLWLVGGVVVLESFRTVPRLFILLRMVTLFLMVER